MLAYAVAGCESLLTTMTTADKSRREFHVGTVYRHPQSSRTEFRQAMSHIVGHMTPGLPVIITGDFNDEQQLSSDGTDRRWVSRTLEQLGFKTQIIPLPTTDFGSTIDHVYTREFNDLHIRVTDCYYSDHDYVNIYLQF